MYSNGYHQLKSESQTPTDRPSIESYGVPLEVDEAEETVCKLSYNAWPSLTKLASLSRMRVNVGEAKTNLSQLLARVEAGEDVEIARDGVPVARLVRVKPVERPGERFLKGWGAMAGQIWISDDFEFSEEELDQMFAEMDEDWELN